METQTKYFANDPTPALLCLMLIRCPEIQQFSVFVAGFQPIISVMSATNETKYGDCGTPEVTFQGAHNSNNFLSETDKTARNEVQV